ncbi:Meiotically up-regulated 80 [Hyphodiscus hymeniophilus]|uniref:Meiotically up-regulated 80 n=1 Tax=Hyphodiscus hymeniophilus TaxID=353542 RepID=A0A9P7AWY5_9HELO|nr:Meiotically up-regulated 80 [Hyphodiscus hymeniophilus]
MHRTSARPAPLDFLLPSNAPYGIDRRKDLRPLQTVPQLTPGYLEAPLRDGLRTPPADEMGTAYQYQPAQSNNYGRRSEATYSSGAHSGATYAGSYVGGDMPERQYSSISQPPPASVSTLRNEVQAPSSAYKNQPPSPQPANRTNVLAPPEGLPRGQSANSDMILPNLQIPSSINNSGGSLAEFAAQITSLFWFESTETLRKAEGLSPSSSPIKRLSDEALPSSGFRKWVVTILSTTQVSQNVILLALLFIYRLKTLNPTVKGRTGSEYRLLTVALMLGNKFLDDNTYTNKTWAEVSGISVTEIHVMEVEFLSNMRYSLLASKEQWQQWQEKLGKFWTYCDTASKAPVSQMSTHAFSGQQAPLPSPPASMQASPPSTTGLYPPSSGSISYNQNWPANNHAAPLVSPLPEFELRHMPRKRSYDGDSEEPAAKRVTRPQTNGPSSFHPTMPPLRKDVPRLPVPNLTISTSQTMGNNYPDVTSFAQHAPLLPPLNGRAMSTVYPTTPAWTPQLPMLTPTGPPNQHGPLHSNGFTTPSRRQSPHSVQELLSLGSSPISAHFPTNHNSPSFFLQQRASPYRPVRHVNTLLYPPPSASMHDYTANVDQIHYQPLGKRNEYRPGVVPSYHYPVLPQPNFHA